MDDVEWSRFDQYSEDTIECRCGKIYRSHCKGVVIGESYSLITRKPCPGCGETQDHVRAARSDPEYQVIS